MLAKQRQALILDEIRRTGGVRVRELTSKLGVSDMTIRRDLHRLEQAGALEKVHGGAVLDRPADVRRAPVVDEPSFDAKARLHQDAKQAIAARAAVLVRPGTAIAVSAGTTTWAMVEHLAEIPDLTIVTNSITVAESVAALGDTTKRTVILTGGVRTPSAALVGPVADLTIRSLNVDRLFIGTFGIDMDAGLTSPNLAEADTNRALIAQARHVVVLADSTKWRTVGLASWASLDDADLLITDDGMSPDAREQLTEVGLDVVTVPTG